MERRRGSRSSGLYLTRFHVCFALAWFYSVDRFIYIGELVTLAICYRSRLCMHAAACTERLDAVRPEQGFAPCGPMWS